ncbi:hypothetical protein ABW19_dt0201417 [Dactylella cylindrospora]|nr:hypothetical protein ABW19_dt0201417 [Dactylella cylindrospora]
MWSSKLYPVVSAIIFYHLTRAEETIQLLARQDPTQCNQTSFWEQSYEQYDAQGVTNQARAWWTGESGKGRSFANALGSDFGDHVRGFDCGIGKSSTCLAPSCSDFLAEPDKVWAYLARAAVVNMGYAFNALYTGVTNGQLDFIGLIPDIVATFIPEGSSGFDPKLLGIWLTAAVGVIIAAFPPARPLIAALAVLSGGIATLTEELEEIKDNMQSIDVLGQFAASYGEQTRNTIETWATELFNGTKDSSGSDIM